MRLTLRTKSRRNPARRDGSWRRYPIAFALVRWFDGSLKILVAGVFERRWSNYTRSGKGGWIYRDAGASDDRIGGPSKRPIAASWFHRPR